MGSFVRGDVIIAKVPCFGRNTEKLRPAVVVGSDRDNNLIVVPVSSQPSADTPSLTLSLEDFSEGGLDMFNDSFILVSHATKLHPRDVVGKRGHLTEEFFGLVIASVYPGTTGKKH
jgi:mRNA-degrading endonuclease toxin of MazEF toxin-antitoxin module